MSGCNIFHRQRFSAYLICVCCASFMVFAVGCGDESSHQITADNGTADTPTAGSATFSIQWHAASNNPDPANAFVKQSIDDCAAAGVEMITCEVYDESNNPIASGGPWPCDAQHASINRIPAGPNRMFAVLGWNQTGGQIIYQGKSTSGIEITPGEIADAGTIDATPFVPTRLVAESSSNSQITLSWDNMGTYDYRIYQNGIMIPTPVSQISPPYTITDLTPGTEYCYTVSSYDDFGNESGHSNQACATTPLLSTWYRDADADGYGNPNDSTQTNSQPSGYVADNTDCDDTDETIHPSADETCNDIDDNCNGTTDEGVQNTYYRDADSDEYGDSGNSTQACAVPSGYVSNSTDCNDADDTIFPGAPERYDGIDNDCDGLIDEDLNTYYRDADQDTYGDPNTTTQANSQPSGYVSNNTDCDDTDRTIHPNANETCNGVDDDCDGSTDEGVQNTYYRDADSDGYGNSGNSTQACSAPSGYVANSTDCNDADASVHPNASETCNGVDDDCDGSTDEGVQTTYYRDADSDGYGNSANSTQTCTTPSGYVSNGTDCNDADASVHPNASETCNGVDDDCDGSTDEGVQTTYYRDADSDGYGNANNTDQACSAPTGYVTSSSDCDDTDASIHPGASEICDDNIDNNCNGDIDEDCVQCTYTVTIGDNDGYGAGVADNANLPENSGTIEPWIFDNRESNEMNATDGSQHTDYAPYNSRSFTFTITFCPANPNFFYYAAFTLDVSGIQADNFGSSTLYLDGQDYSQNLNQEQGVYGSDVITIYIYDVSLFTDGELTVEFQGGEGNTPGTWNPDAIAFDFFRLNTDNY